MLGEEPAKRKSCISPPCSQHAESSPKHGLSPFTKEPVQLLNKDAPLRWSWVHDRRRNQERSQTCAKDVRYIANKMIQQHSCHFFLLLTHQDRATKGPLMNSSSKQHYDLRTQPCSIALKSHSARHGLY
eukprot:832106-Amphidinium_carterae.2